MIVWTAYAPMGDQGIIVPVPRRYLHSPTCTGDRRSLIGAFPARATLEFRG